jgi:Leucine-rich repeat (LRR) protein
MKLAMALGLATLAPAANEGRLGTDAAEYAHTWITDADLASAGAAAELRRIDLSHTRITDLGLEHLRGLKNVVDLNCLFCEYVTEDGIAHLAGWKKVERLNLRGTKVTSKVFDHLAKLTSLRELDLSSSQIDDEGFENLAALGKLESLAIGGNRLNGSGLAFLKLLPALRKLDVSGIQRVDSGLWGLPLTDANLERLGGLTALTELDLSGANLADRGVDRPGHPEAERSELKDLSKLRGLVRLRKLDLSRTPVTAKTLETIAGLPELVDLRLGYAPNIGDDAVPVLLSMKKLETVYLAGTKVTDEGKRRLRAENRLAVR